MLGANLIQLMISVSIMSVLSLMIADFVLQQQISFKKMEEKIEKTNLVASIDTVLKDDTACRNSFLSNNVSFRGPTNIPDLNDQFGNVLLSSNTQNGNLLIGQITIENSTVPGPDSSGFVFLNIPISRVSNGGGQKTLKPIRSRFLASVDASNNISSCKPKVVPRGPGTVTIRTGPSPVGCSCNPDELRTGCTGTVRGDGNTYASGPLSCSSDRRSNVMCICYKSPI